MPELPEVETIARELRHSSIIESKIETAEVLFDKTIATPSVDQFIATMKGKKILDVNRRGKYLVFLLSGHLFLVIHLRMTGRFSLVSPDSSSSIHEHVILHLSGNKQLRFHDTRKFGRWHLVADLPAILGKLGPEPLDEQFKLADFIALIEGKSRQLKPLLLDQEFIAGLGNIYVDEALWEAQLHPQLSAHKLSSSNMKNLYLAIRHVLKRGLEAQGTSLGKGKPNFFRLDGKSGSHQNLLNVYHRTGQPCPRCQNTIVRLIVAQRSTHICPHCQSKV